MVWPEVVYVVYHMHPMAASVAKTVVHGVGGHIGMADVARATRVDTRPSGAVHGLVVE